MANEATSYYLPGVTFSSTGVTIPFTAIPEANQTTAADIRGLVFAILDAVTAKHAAIPPTATSFSANSTGGGGTGPVSSIGSVPIKAWTDRPQLFATRKDVAQASVAELAANNNQAWILTEYRIGFLLKGTFAGGSGVAGWQNPFQDVAVSDLNQVGARFSTTLTPVFQ